MKLDTPSVSVEKKSNEQNIQTLKSWCGNTAAELNYSIASLEERVAAIESALSNSES